MSSIIVPSKRLPELFHLGASTIRLQFSVMIQVQQCMRQHILIREVMLVTVSILLSCEQLAARDLANKGKVAGRCQEIWF